MVGTAKSFVTIARSSLDSFATSAESPQPTAFPHSSVPSLRKVSPMSSHSEAPEISKDPVADSTDLYAFISPTAPTRSR